MATNIIQSEIRRIRAEVATDVKKVAENVRSNIAQRTPVDTGVTRSQWQVTTRVQRKKVESEISNPSEVAAYLHTGTGIYGPTGTPIRPKRAKVLKFRPRGSRGYIFRPQVRGMPPSDYIIAGTRAGSPWPVQVLSPPGSRL